MTSHNFDDKVYIKGSAIHGSGVFTSVAIPKHSLIMPIDGEEISVEECERRENEENNVYIFWKTDESFLDVSSTPKIKYINHLCDSNCEVVEDDNGQLWLYSIKDILAHEELTIDYGYEEIYQHCACDFCDPDSDQMNFN
jgi:hypothetical protein